MRPVDPIEFKDTESLDAFYQAYYADNNQLVRFEKYLVEREEIDERQVINKLPSGSIYYFEVIPPKDDKSKPTRGRVIDYPQVEFIGQYIKGTVSRSCTFMRLVLVRHQFTYADEYIYWSNGKLKTRIQTKQDGKTINSDYDESGNEMTK
ncbi:MAG: hypothetical protein DM484_00815 [Candidatus Methylumidiphilus alinenensis]|uniref:Uncharacterized protein n=1 Tax=Candidatus Methylumidiphilus alinenensis TaxID=2202197 RepID=A0A2W4RUA6_9GAMM|nr:MAG: hypothetical protein DM484_00815 [Candidatus Methylumidiphilus alinenensis]